MNREELSAASAIGLLYLIRMLGLFMVLPVLPLFADDIAGATPLLIGMALGIYGLSQAALQIPLGMLSDRLGRKPVIALGLVCFIVGSLVAALSDSIFGLIVGRLLQGCGAIASTLLALMSDVTRVDQRGKSMAIIGISIALSFGLSLILGPYVASGWGVAAVFYLSAALGVVGLVLLFGVVPSTQVMTTNLDSAVQQGRLKSVLGDASLWRMNTSIFSLHFLLVSAFSAFPILFLETGNIEADEHALYYLGLLIASFLLMTPFMWLSDRMGRPLIFLVGAVGVIGLSFLLLATLASYLAVLAGVVLFFMAFNLLEVLLPAQVSRMAAAGGRGTAMGVYTSCQFLGIFAGGLVSGWVLQSSDIEQLMWVNFLIACSWMLIAATLPATSHIGNRTVQLRDSAADSITGGANAQAIALLSINGVIDAVVIDQGAAAGKVAYLKVDEQRIDDQALAQWKVDS